MTAQFTSQALQSPVQSEARPQDAGTELGAPKRGCGWLQIILFAIGSFLYGFYLVRTADAEVLFFRHFWLDEYLTSLVALDRSTLHAIKAVADGVDTNPPVYHMLVR